MDEENVAAALPAKLCPQKISPVETAHARIEYCRGRFNSYGEVEVRQFWLVGLGLLVVLILAAAGCGSSETKTVTETVKSAQTESLCKLLFENANVSSFPPGAVKEVRSICSMR